MAKEKEFLTSLITDFINDNPQNSMGEKFPGEKMWDSPLIGFASASDTIFKDFKSEDICGAQHWTPAEIFALTFPEENFIEEQLTVVSWILPQTKETKEEMRKTEYPAERWSRTRLIGEVLNNDLRKHFVKILAEKNIPAVAPMLSPAWKSIRSEKLQITSTWSERHAAYAAGLGTFALCDGLITKAGKAHRCGSVVIKAKIEPDQRPYKEHAEYCLYFNNGTCGTCIKRCPYGALSFAGHDKKKCHLYQKDISIPYIKKKFDIDGYACGLCQTAVPCESQIPLQK